MTLHKQALLYLLGLLASLAFGPLALGAALIEPFLGDYAGSTVIEENGVELQRDLGVSITTTDHGFKVFWKTSTIKADGRIKTKEFDISFTPTERKHVFQAAQRPSLFGGTRPLDPMKGEPYVWAKVINNTLTIYALHILDDGGYELQIYDRSLAETGLNLEYSRIRDGEKLRTISTTLIRQ